MCDTGNHSTIFYVKSILKNVINGISSGVSDLQNQMLVSVAAVLP